MTKPWMIDELAHAGPEHLDPNDRKQGTTIPPRGYTREDFAEHFRTEYSTFRWLFEPMLTTAGFEIISADFRGSVYGAYTCIKPA